MTQQTDVPTPSAQIDPHRLESVLSDMRSQQNLALAIAMGTLAAAVGAGLWALATVLTGYQIGFMAIGVGILVGLTVRQFGKGIDKSFGFIGAGLAFAGCVAGNVLAICGLVSIEEGVSFLSILGRLDMGVTWQLMVATFSPIDVLFYGLAIWEGYKFSFRQITLEELPELRSGSPA